MCCTYVLFMVELRAICRYISTVLRMNIANEIIQEGGPVAASIIEMHGRLVVVIVLHRASAVVQPSVQRILTSRLIEHGGDYQSVQQCDEHKIILGLAGVVGCLHWCRGPPCKRRYLSKPWQKPDKRPVAVMKQSF